MSWPVQLSKRPRNRPFRPSRGRRTHARAHALTSGRPAVEKPAAFSAASAGPSGLASWFSERPAGGRECGPVPAAIADEVVLNQLKTCRRLPSCRVAAMRFSANHSLVALLGCYQQTACEDSSPDRFSLISRRRRVLLASCSRVSPSFGAETKAVRNPFFSSSAKRPETIFDGEPAAVDTAVPDIIDEVSTRSSRCRSR